MNANESINMTEFLDMMNGEYPEKSGRECREAFEMVMSVMGDILGNGRGINFSGFGTFEVHDREGKHLRHPSTGENLDIGSYKSVTFRLSQQIKRRLNNGNA